MQTGKHDPQPIHPTDRTATERLLEIHTEVTSSPWSADALQQAIATDKVSPIRFVPSMEGEERKKRISLTDSIRSIPLPIRGTEGNE
jgi:hypothetical protein